MPNLFNRLSRHKSKSQASESYASSSQASKSYAISSKTPQADDPFTFLSVFDTVFLIDDSGSMTFQADSHNHRSPSRWTQTSQALAELAPICTQYDSDGIDIQFLNHRGYLNFLGITRASDVISIFQQVSPTNGTPTGARIQDILRPYVEDCREAHRKGRDAPKPLNLIVITDGEPNDRRGQDVETVLVNIAKQLDEIEADGQQIGVQFLQVGDDAGASESLRVLDDDLKEKHGCRDFVDTQRFVKGGEAFGKDLVLKTVLGAVHRKWDRKTVSGTG